jgi:hypothetical protein
MHATQMAHDLAPAPVHAAYTRGIEVHNVHVAGCAGEFSAWEFGGYTPYHQVGGVFVLSESTDAGVRPLCRQH